MERRELICIGCPLGCALTVSMEGAEVVSVTGNTCKRGDVYARKEVTNPTRIVTSTVKVSNGTADMVSVKTKEEADRPCRYGLPKCQRLNCRCHFLRHSDCRLCRKSRRIHCGGYNALHYAKQSHHQIQAVSDHCFGEDKADKELCRVLRPFDLRK